MNIQEVGAFINDLQGILDGFRAESRVVHGQLTDAGVPRSLNVIMGRMDAGVPDCDANLRERVDWLIRKQSGSAKELIELYVDTISQSLDESLREFNAGRAGPNPIKENTMIHVDISSIPAEAYILQVTMTDHAQWDIPEAKQAVFADIEMPRGDTGSIRIAWSSRNDVHEGQYMLAQCFEKLSKRTIVKTDIPVNPQDPASDPLTLPAGYYRVTGRLAGVCEFWQIEDVGHDPDGNTVKSVRGLQQACVFPDYHVFMRSLSGIVSEYPDTVWHPDYDRSIKLPGSQPLSDTVTQILESVERITGCSRPEAMLNWLEAWELTRREAAGKGPPTLREDIASAINKHSAENGSNTPDHVLAAYLVGCLEQFDTAIKARNRWWAGQP